MTDPCNAPARLSYDIKMDAYWLIHDDRRLLLPREMTGAVNELLMPTRMKLNG